MTNEPGGAAHPDATRSPEPSTVAGRAEAPATLPELPPQADRLPFADRQKALRDHQSASWRAGLRVAVEFYRDRVPGLSADSEGLFDLVRHEVHLRREKGERASLAEYLKRFPSLSGRLVELWPPPVRPSVPTTPTVAPQNETVPLAPSAATDSFPPTLDGPAPAVAPTLPGQPTDTADQLIPYAMPVPDARVPGYQILGELGRGGMGVVYKARQVALKRLVALKMILAGPHAGPSQIARFRTEAESVARFQHPNIVQIYEIGEHKGLPYCALEFVDGGSLDRRLAGKPLPTDEAAQLSEALARAVHYAHQRGVLHRDLKPANVLLGSGGCESPERPHSGGSHPPLATPKITDFGLAKQLDDDSGQTQSGQIMGTPSYMAPEQAEGRLERLGPHTDVYALGAILYECLTGRPPFRGVNVMDTLDAVRTIDPEPPGRINPKVPRDLEIICLKCLRKDPAARYSSALALAQDLERFLAGEPILARQEGAVRKLMRKVRRNRNAVLAGLAVVVALVVAGTFWLGSRKAREASALAAEIQTGLDADAWTPAHADALDTLIDRLVAVDPVQAAALRQKSREQYRLSLLKALQRPRLSPEDVRRLEEDLKGLAARDVAAANELAEKLRQRLGEWMTVLDLKAPFENWEAAFRREEVTVEGAKLIARRRPDAPANDRTIASTIDCDGNVVVEAMLDPSWDQSAAVGVVLNLSRGHNSWVRSMAFSPDGQSVATAGHDGTVRVWDLSTGTERQTLPISGRDVQCLAFGKNGTLYAVGGPPHVLVAIDARSVTVSERVELGNAAALSVAVSPDSKRLATGCWNHEIQLWSLPDLKPAGKLVAHTGAVHQMAFTADSRSLVSVSEDKTARLWDLEERKPRTFVGTHPGKVRALALSPDGRTLATAEEKAVTLWDIPEGKKRLTIQASSGSGHNLAFLSGGRALAFGSRVFDVDSGDESRHFGQQWWHAHAVALDPDGRRLALYVHNSVKICDTSTRQELATLGGWSYELLLTTAASHDEKGKPSTLAEARRGGGQLVLEVRRNGALQQQQPVDAGPGPLLLRATREADVVTIQAGKERALRFRDPSPLPIRSGRAGLHWPDGVGVSSLMVQRQSVPPVQSLLEQGDELLLRGKALDALPKFEDQITSSDTPQTALEARYKAGLCELRLNRPEQAARRFEALATERGERWPLLAAGQLWLIRLQSDQVREADDLFRVLEKQYRHEDVLATLPIELRLAILSKYKFQRADALLQDPGRLARFQTLDKIVEFLEVERTDLALWVGTKYGLARAHFLAGDQPGGLTVLRGVLDRMGNQYSHLHGLILGEYCWAMQVAGQSAEALRELNRWQPPDADPETMNLTLCLERARLKAALGKTDEALADVDLVLAVCARKPPGLIGSVYAHHAHASIIKGLLLEDRSDKKGAEATWLAGTREEWKKTVPDEVAARESQNFAAERDDMAMSAWTGRLSDAQAKAALDRLVAPFGENSLPALVVKNVDLPPATLREMWKIPRGRALAKRCAFHAIPYREYVQQPVILMGVAFAHVEAVTELTPEKEEVLWKSAEGLFKLYFSGKLSKRDLALSAGCWTGLGEEFAWGLFKKPLPPEVLAPVSYVLGCRALKRERPERARIYFETARDANTTDDTVKKLAEDELERLKRPR